MRYTKLNDMNKISNIETLKEGRKYWARVDVIVVGFNYVGPITLRRIYDDGVLVLKFPFAVRPRYPMDNEEDNVIPIHFNNFDLFELDG